MQQFVFGVKEGIAGQPQKPEIEREPVHDSGPSVWPDLVAVIEHEDGVGRCEQPLGTRPFRKDIFQGTVKHVDLLGGFSHGNPRINAQPVIRNEAGHVLLDLVGQSRTIRDVHDR